MVFDLIITGLAVGSLYGLIAISISIIYSGLDIIHFAQGEIFALGAFLCWFFYQGLGIPIIWAAVLGIFCTVFFSVLLLRTIYNPILKMSGGFSVRGLTFVVAGFGASIILQNVYWLIWDPSPKPLKLELGDPLVLGELSIQPIYILIIEVSSVLMIALYIFFKKTKLGLAMKAVAYNKPIASLMGVNVNLVMGFTFGLAAALSGIAGILMAPIIYVQYNMGMILFMKGFCSAVLGGLGNVVGAILGGIILGVVESFGAAYISSAHKDMISFVILILVLMFSKHGLFATKTLQKA